MKTTLSDEPIKVLLIDDDEDDYLLTRDLFFEFKAVRYQLDWISNYTDALQAIVRNEYHVCLVDYRLGERNGVELISEAQENGCQIPIILLTGQDAHDIDVEAMTCGAVDYLVKGQTNAALLERAVRYAVSRKQSEERLRESEERLKAQYKGIPIPTYTWRKVKDDFVLIDFNDAAEKITQGNVSRIIGITLKEMYGDRPDIFNNFNRCFNTRSNVQDDTEFQFKPTGEIKQLDVSYVFILPDIVMVHTRDVTEQVESENARRASERKFRKVLENSRDIIYQFNLQTKNFEYMSPSAKEISGYDAEEFLDGGFSFSNALVHPEDLELLKDYVQTALNTEETGNIAQTIEYRLKTKENGYRWVSENRTVVRNENNIPAAIIATARDITEQKQIEETLRFQNTLLELQSETSIDGILVIGKSRELIFHNRHFVDIWEIPEQALNSRSDEKLLERVLEKLVDPEEFLERLAYVYQLPDLKEHTEIYLKDGRILDRYTAPVVDANNTYYGRIWYFRDITQRKRDEAALEQSGKDYRTIFEQAHDAIIVMAPEQEIILDVNQRACKLYGFSRSEFIGMSMEVISKNPVRGRRKIKETLQTGDYINFETQQFRKDESEMFVEANASPIIYQGQQAIITINRDITERKMVENKLRQSEANLAAAQRITHLGSWEVELSDLRYINNNKVHWSDEVYRLFGFEPGQIKPSIRHFFNSIHRDDHRRARKAFFETITDRKDLNIEFRVALPDNSDRILHGQAEVIYDGQSGKSLKLIGTVQDITESRQAEVALLEANEKAIREYERLLERIAQLAGTFGSARDLQTIYRALHAFSVVSVPCTGFFISLYDSNRELRTPVYACSDGEEFDVSNLPALGTTASPNSRAVSTGTIIIEDDFQQAMAHKPVVNIGFDKNPGLPQSCLVAPMSVMGSIIGAVEVQSTERASYTKEHATAMQMAANLAATAIENVRLFEQEREKDEQLRQSQKLESVGRLAGGIAHDFNNMLTAINGYSDLTLRRLSDGDPLRRNIEEIKKAGQRSASLTHQLLAFSRRQILQPRILDLNEVVADTIKMLRRLIGEDIYVTTNLTRELSYIKADPGQLTQVIMNLLVNARDAMPQGGNLLIETKNVCLDEDFAAKHIPTQPGSYVLLSVKDTGIGMNAETQKNIFEPFYTTKEIGKGTGLGLATVYGIIKQSDGYIWADSEVGKGTTFHVYLPPVEVESETKDAPEILEESSYGAEIILLVEDEEMVRNLSREMLITCGYKVIEASNGIEALEICRQINGKIDLLLTDVVMPKMGGRELAENLIKLQPHIKVLFTSGYTDDSIVRHGINEADINFIQKPFTFDTLAGKVRDVLDS